MTQAVDCACVQLQVMYPSIVCVDVYSSIALCMYMYMCIQADIHTPATTRAFLWLLATLYLHLYQWYSWQTTHTHTHTHT